MALSFVTAVQILPNIHIVKKINMRLDQRQTHWHFKKKPMAQSDRCLIHLNKNVSEINIFRHIQIHNLYSSSLKMINAAADDDVVLSGLHSLGFKGAVGRMRLDHDRCVLT